MYFTYRPIPSFLFTNFMTLGVDVLVDALIGKKTVCLSTCENRTPIRCCEHGEPYPLWYLYPREVGVTAVQENQPLASGDVQVRDTRATAIQV